MAHAGQSNPSQLDDSLPLPDLSTLPGDIWLRPGSISRPDVVLVTETHLDPTTADTTKVGQQSDRLMHHRHMIRTTEMTEGANYLALQAFRKRMATGTTVEIPQQIFQPMATSCNNNSPSYPRAIQSLTSSVPGIVFYSQQALKFAEQVNALPGHLSKHEVAVLNLFLRQFGRDEHCLYQFVQQLLLCEDRTRVSLFDPFLEFLTRTLGKLPSFRGNVWHRVKKDLVDVYPRDHVFTWKAFLSCSVTFESLKEDSNRGEATLFSIATTSGRLIHQFAEGLDVPEVLIQPGTYFQVLSTLDAGSGLKIIQLKEVECLGKESEQNSLLSASASEVQENCNETRSHDDDLQNLLELDETESDIACMWTSMKIGLSLADTHILERCLDCVARVRAEEIRNDSQTQLLRRDVAYIMGVYRIFSSIQIKGCRALRKLSRPGLFITDAVQQTSVGVVLAAMERHPGVASLHEESLALLVKLCSNSALVGVLEAQNGIETVLCSMRQHPGNKTVNQVSCRLLSKIADINHDIASTIHGKGGVKDIVGALRLLREEPPLQMSGWWALLSLAGDSIVVDDEDEGQTNNFATVILQAMELYTKQVGVQAEGLLALRNLVQRDINELGTNESISVALTLSALRVHSQNEVVADNGCAVLAGLTQTRKNTLEVVSDGGISCLLSVMQQHFNIATVQEQASKALRNIATNGSRGPSIEDDPSKPVLDADPDAISTEPSHVPANEPTSFPEDLSHDYRLVITEAGGKEIILLAMKTHPNHVGIQRQGCLAIRTLSVSLANEVDVMRTDDVNVILSALTRHCDSISLQRAALRTLVVLAVNPQNKATVAKCGGLDVVLFSLSTHPEDEKLQEDGMNMLKELSLNALAEYRIVRQGGLGTVLSAMTAHSHNPKIQEKGCEILANIISSQRTTLHKPMASSSNDLVEHSCDASGNATAEQLSNISGRVSFNVQTMHHRTSPAATGINGSIPMLLAEAGVIDHIVRTMQAFPKDTNVQKHCCRALAALAVCAVNVNMIIGLSGMDLVLSAMREHSMNNDIQLEGCRAVRAVYASEDMCNRASGSHATDAVVSAMNLHSQNKAIQLEGCRALAILVHDIQNRAKLVEYGAIDAVLTAMRSHHGDVLVQEFGCRFLGDITHLPTLLSEVRSIFFTAPEMTARAQITSGGRLDTILQTMNLHEDNRIIQILCARLLLCLSADKSSRKRIISKGGKDFVKGAMDRFAEDEAVQRICTDLLTFIGEPEPSK